MDSCLTDNGSALRLRTDYNISRGSRRVLTSVVVALLLASLAIWAPAAHAQSGNKVLSSAVEMELGYRAASDAMNQISGGDFIGTTPFASGIAPQPTLTTLFSVPCVPGNCPDGWGLYSALLQGGDGNFYGSTGDVTGIIFKLPPSGALTVFYSFYSATDSGIGCAFDGASALIQDRNGNFYGTCGGSLGGMVFKLTPSGKLAVLYSFCSQGGDACTDGANPTAALIQGRDGNFYGTTSEGGIATTYAPSGAGTVFKLTPSGTLTTLYSFCSQNQGGNDCTDGSTPYAGLIEGRDGNLYGTTSRGGTGGAGTVFKFDLHLRRLGRPHS